jgi:tetratricopeptide (TPR) repeat protein
MKSDTRNIWLILILILFSGRNTFAQPSDRDKLLLQISKEANDTTRIKLLIRLGMVYALNDADQDRWLNEVDELSRIKKYGYGLVFGKYHEARRLVRIGKVDQAIEKYKECIDGLDSLRIIQPIISPLSELRLLFNLQGKQVDKFQYYTDKIVFYKRQGPKENIATCLHAIGGYYSFFANYDKAIEYFLRAREIYKSYDPTGYANEIESIGTMYLEWGNLDKAEVFFQSALKELASDKFVCYHNLGDIYSLRHNYKRALYYYCEGKKYSIGREPQFQAINLVSCASGWLGLNSIDSARIYLENAEKIRSKENLGIDFSHGEFELDFTLYKYYLAIRSDKQAEKCLERALKEARTSMYLPLVLKYTMELYSCLLRKGDSLQALRYLVRYHSIRDSLNKINAQARIASFEIEQQQQQRENEIEQLKVQKAKQRNYYLFGGALLLLIVIAIISIIIYKRKRDKEQLTTDFKKQLAQAETKALRAQMNPHFIFNSLNSINSFVMDQKHEIASEYLIKFSKLIRLILDNSRNETISLEKELETLKLYVLLESARFDNKFKCVYNIAEDVNTNSIIIPPMLLQPFVENAIWHGLMQKKEEGTITVEIKKQDEEFLNISISDNGIGREKAAELKSKSATHKSHGLKVTSQRIEMMNKLNSSGAHVNVIDLKDEQGNATGTRVELIIPF